MPFSVWSASTLFAILSKLIRVWTFCHSFSTVLSKSTLFAILSSLIRIYTTSYSQQSDQGQGLHCHSQEQPDQRLHYMPFSAVWSGSTLFSILSLIKFYTICHSQQSDQRQGPLLFEETVRSESILFAILSSLIRVYTVCRCQQSVLFVILSHLIRVYTFCHSRSDQGLYYLPFSAVWSGSKTICHSQQSHQGLHCFPLSAVWSESTLFAILSRLNRDYTISIISLIRVYTISIISLIRVYTFCHSQQSDQDLHYLAFFLSSIIKVNTVCHS